MFAKMKKAYTLYLDSDIWLPFKDKARSKGASGSAKLEEMMKKDLCEGSETPAPISLENYEALKGQQDRLATKIDKLIASFQKQGTFKDLYDFTQKVGVDLDKLHNLEEKIPILLGKWEGTGDIHRWITFLELVKAKREVESKLQEIRLRGKNGG